MQSALRISAYTLIVVGGCLVIPAAFSFLAVPSEPVILPALAGAIASAVGVVFLAADSYDE